MKKTKRVLGFAIFIIIGMITPPSWASGLEDSVVKVITNTRYPSFTQPWSSGSPSQISGSGVILKNHLILTNAHVVSYNVFVQVQKAGSSQQYEAHVKYIGHDTDLALLQVDDPSFFKGTQPVDWGDTPQLGTKVTTYGFPTGGTQMSITSGVVSRIEVVEYSYSQDYLLAIQTDAAINPGNSGGPVFQGQKCIGIAFQTLDEKKTENIGYIIPTLVIRHFFNAISKGVYTGVPYLSIFWEGTDNQDLRDYYQLPPDQTGILVTAVLPESSAWGYLKKNDVILSIDHTPIASDGTVLFRPQERVNFSYLISRHQMGDVLPIQVFRNGKVVDLSVPLKYPMTSLVPMPQYDVTPTYYIYGGLVFTVLTYDYMDCWNDWNQVPLDYRYLYDYALPDPNQQIVILDQVLPAGVNVGYQSCADNIVKEVNGIPISNMHQLIQALAKPKGKYQVIQFSQDDENLEIILNAEKCAEMDPTILQKAGITSDCSPDLEAFAHPHAQGSN